ncbi:MAG TPA: glycosyltransferase [Polyangiaceae bacterium]|nr:glycosyltransferase [Polyangiaceae bacterium]
MSHDASSFALAWALAYASCALWAVIRSWRAGGASSPSRPSEAQSPASALRVLLLRPCAGLEPELDRTLASTARARRAFAMDVRFAVESHRDAAAPSVDRAVDVLERAGVPASAVMTHARAANRKAAQLARAHASAPRGEELVVVADSDVDLEDAPLDALVGALSDDSIGAAWAAPIEIQPTTVADRASAAVLDASLHAFPLLSALDPSGMVGKLFVIRTDALAKVGGFGALTTHLGEDMELARRLREVGLKTTVAPLVARSRAQGRAWGAVIERYARWIRVVRAQRPHLLPTYPLLLCAAPLIVTAALLAALAGSAGSGPGALTAAGLTVVARVATGARARALGGRTSGARALVVDVVLADALLLVAFARACLTRRTVWRGVHLLPEAGGRFTEEAR